MYHFVKRLFLKNVSDWRVFFTLNNLKTTESKNSIIYVKTGIKKGLTKAIMIKKDTKKTCAKSQTMLSLLYGHSAYILMG